MNAWDVQTLVLRAPHGPAVAHLIVQFPEGKGRAAAGFLRRALAPSFGPQNELHACCSVGFSFAGLEALGVPESYLRLFARLAPAFREGAVRRSVHLGDSGKSAALHWKPGFNQDRAHALVSWHGEVKSVSEHANRVAEHWKEAFDIWLADPLVGKRLGRPDHEAGEWVHFGFRDGISEVCIDNALPCPAAIDRRDHRAGALLLGEINDASINPFALSQAPEKVRAFFRDSSFGILRPMAQDLAAFEEQIDQWVAALASSHSAAVTRDFVKAKLCGRWPDGRLLRPGELKPGNPSLALDLTGDDAGEGCPFGSHVRRMRAAPDGTGQFFVRPLQRRGMPFGAPAWSGRPDDGEQRGLLGHFFCASIEDQFEHLLGQWAASPPLGLAPGDRALDPLIGPHEDAHAALEVPMKGRSTQRLEGFRAWTTTLGTMYAWHPGRHGLNALLTDDFVRDEDQGPWL